MKKAVLMIENKWPYNTPLWRAHWREESPNGKFTAEIKDAREVSMGNPTYGTLVLSSGLAVERCNPSFIWSDDSVYLAVSQFSYNWLWGTGKQRLLIIDANKGMVWQSLKLAYYIQPKSFVHGVLTVTLNPTHKPRTMLFRVPQDLAEFEQMEDRHES